MCIALMTTAHPHYPFILLNNRDEYLNRATAPATWWSAPNVHVLGGYDLEREEKGTWLGITKQGRVAVLTNFKEEGQPLRASKSRGGIIKEFLTTLPESVETTEKSAERLIVGYRNQDVGGFSLALGQVNPSKSQGEPGLAIISNRTPDVTGATWIATAPGMIHGLSNSHYGDRTWPKVTQGEQMLAAAVKESVNKREKEDKFIERLFQILCTNTMPRRRSDESWEAYLYQLRKSIFIPALSPASDQHKSADEIAAANGTEKLSSSSGAAYGTQKQTVILVKADGRVVFVERTLYDQRGRPVEKSEGERRFDFVCDC
ncbi:MAG: hypothetical protein M1820_005594 [Bogoriella megaspora]|nr:MAG: hypothetical protein M1820_005594 [Bogoriella megaspora]